MDSIYFYEQKDIDELIKETPCTILIDHKYNEKYNDYKPLRNINSLEGRDLYFRNVNTISINNCDFNKDENIEIHNNVSCLKMTDTTIESSLRLIIDEEMKHIEFKNCFIDNLRIFNCHNIDDIILKNTIINNITIKRSTIDRGILYNHNSVINNLKMDRSYINNIYKKRYNDELSYIIKTASDAIIDNINLIDFVKGNIEIKESCIIEDEGDKIYSYSIIRDEGALLDKANNDVVRVNATSIMPEQAEPPIVSIPIYDMTYESTLCIDDDNDDGVEGNE